jgi:hypothetical protein
MKQCILSYNLTGKTDFEAFCVSGKQGCDMVLQSTSQQCGNYEYLLSPSMPCGKDVYSNRYNFVHINYDMPFSRQTCIIKSV